MKLITTVMKWEKKKELFKTVMNITRATFLTSLFLEDD